MNRPDHSRLIDLEVYLQASQVNQADRRCDQKSRTVLNFAKRIDTSTGRLAATNYALAAGVPGHVVKRVLHDADDAP